jgi:hypothetical protein
MRRLSFRVGGSFGMGNSWLEPRLARREGPRYTPRPDASAWNVVTIKEQWQRSVEDVPCGQSRCCLARNSAPRHRRFCCVLALRRRLALARHALLRTVHRREGLGRRLPQEREHHGLVDQSGMNGGEQPRRHRAPAMRDQRQRRQMGEIEDELHRRPSEPKSRTAAHGVWAPAPIAPKLQLALANYWQEYV